MLRFQSMEDNNMNIQSNENILLTGAGFTKNFGAYLASEMWTEIFNHNKIQAQPKIKELMRNEFDYESVYYSVMEGSSYTKDEKEAINDAVTFVYDNIDINLRKYASGAPHSAELDNVAQFINHFNGIKYEKCVDSNNIIHHIQTKTSNKGFIFTLNQDMFFERLYSNYDLSIPGIKNNPEWFKSSFRTKIDSNYCQLPNERELDCIKQNILSDGYFYLIKLHGSYKWKSFDGSDIMVIGKGKTEQIQKEPLLKYYSEVFKMALSHYQRRLLVIGYSFCDEHINRIIAEAVRDYDLKIYIISPESPTAFKTKMVEKTKHGEDIWQGISGYYHHKLIDIFPEKSSFETQASRNLLNNFFRIHE